MNCREPVWDWTLEQRLGCTLHPNHREDDNALENGPGARSNRPLPDQEIRQVSNAIVDIGSYADERERLTCHTEKLEEAEPAITLVRDNRYAKV